MAAATDPRARAARLLAKTRHAMPLGDALAQARTRRARLLDQPPVNSATPSVPEPLPLLDDPAAFAADFWQKQKDKAPRAKPPRSKSSPKPGRPTKPPSPFSVIDGDRE